MAYEPGERFPEFVGTSHEGETVKLGDYQGVKNLVLFFFSKATTPGCVRETTEFATRRAEFDRLNTQIVGISVDDTELQKEHAGQCGANFPILSDQGAKLTKELGIFNEERNNARRTTYLLDSSGNVREVFPNVQVDGHVDQVLEAVRGISAER